MWTRVCRSWKQIKRSVNQLNNQQVYVYKIFGDISISVPSTSRLGGPPPPLPPKSPTMVSLKWQNCSLTDGALRREATRWDIRAATGVAGPRRRSPCTWTWSSAATVGRAPCRTRLMERCPTQTRRLPCADRLYTDITRTQRSLRNMQTAKVTSIPSFCWFIFSLFDAVSDPVTCSCLW